METFKKYARRLKIPDDHYFVEIAFPNNSALTLNECDQLMDVIRLLYSTRVEGKSYKAKLNIAGRTVMKLPSRQGSINEIVSGPSQPISGTARDLENVIRKTKEGDSLAQSIKETISEEHEVDIKIDEDFTDLEKSVKGEVIVVETYTAKGEKVRQTEIGMNINELA